MGSDPNIDTSGLDAFAADPEMVAEFVSEAREHLIAAEKRLLLIEKNASDMESLNAVFRAIHTIKGLAGFLELKAIQDMAHEVETLLDHARARRLILKSTLVDVLFEGVDSLGIEVDRVERQTAGDSAGPPADTARLLLTLRQVSQHSADTATAHLVGAQRVHSSANSIELVSEPPILSEIAASIEIRGEHPQSAIVHVDDATVRVETAKLDRLMDAVGELVIAQTLVSHNPEVAAIKNPRFAGDLALLHRLAEEIQRITTSIRMVPIGHQFQKTARLVRDLSRQMGKPIALTTDGAETELDKSIAEELSGPLMHMVRNSVDHGIEVPDERARAGKDLTAQIRLAAYYESSQIVIEISDDGRGLNRQKILAKAIERGLVPLGTQLSDSDTFQLIFEPGFSTAEKLTGISGRGVGMDVVRRHVQRLRGRIEIQSEEGVGTKFLLKLPLTLALIEGLVVLVGAGRFILPLSCVTEIFCASESLLDTDAGGTEVVTLRGNVLPVTRLHQRFGLSARSQPLTDGVLIVTESRGIQFCLFVDEMLGKQEIVIKSLGKILEGIKGLMGCAILSDGRVGLIVDVDNIMS